MTAKRESSDYHRVVVAAKCKSSDYSAEEQIVF